MSIQDAPSAVPVPASATVEAMVGRFTRTEISRLQSGVLKDQSAAVAKAARLRRGAGRDASTIPDMWGLIDLNDLLGEDGGLSNRDKERAERAVYAATTLWALHQQSQSLPMHDKKDQTSLGAAVRRLMPPGEIDEQLRKRLVRAGSASNFMQLVVRLREIVQLLRREKISLDYALLAGELYTWQVPGRADRVRRAWGRGFQSRPSQQPTDNSSGETTPEQEDPR